MAGKAIRVRCVSPSLTHARVRQILRKLRAKIKRLEWLPSQWQSPEPLGSRRFPNHNLSTSFLDHPSESGSSLLSCLPLEIRLRIYELVLETSSHPSGCSDRDQNPLFQAIRREPINCIYRVSGRLTVTTPFGHQAGCENNRLALLLVCKQTYAEAVDLLYNFPTFVISDCALFFNFVQSVLPQRLANIRNLCLSFVLRWPEVTSWWHQKNGKPDNAFLWSRVWETVANGMSGLQVLALYIRQFTWNPKRFNTETERRVLLPLVKLRGLRDFKLWYRHERVRDPFGGDAAQAHAYELRGEECQDEAAQTFRQWLETTVKMPRGSSSWYEPIDGCHIAGEMG